MLTQVTTALTTVLSWVGSVVTSLVTSASGTGDSAVAAGALNPLLPMFAVGIAISAFMLGIKAIRSLTWGA